ncbi:MAG: ABC transporter ATP-binding protein [candidate division Zixibacteria bacterium]
MKNEFDNDPAVMLETLNLSKRYEDGVLALDNLSFCVKAGEIFAMLGGNGAGKTTTLNLFLNFIEPTEGEARINGFTTHTDPLRAKEYVSFVSENVILYENFTAIQNLDFFTRIGGKTDYSSDDYRDVLRRVGLADDAHNKRLKQFSKGMRQKCGIAIAILKDAPAILLDEPTSGLDPRAGREFIKLLDSLRGEGKAILMSTHDIFRAKEIADTIAFLDNGHIVMQKNASEIAGKDLVDLYMQYMAGHSAEPANTVEV